MDVLEVVDKCRKIDFNEEQQHLKRIRSNGYTVVEQALNGQLVDQLLIMVQRQFNNQ